MEALVPEVEPQHLDRLDTQERDRRAFWLDTETSPERAVERRQVRIA
jgi:hypothetical protein